MTGPQHISISDYSYLLPEERIANYPLQKRDDSKLLIYRDGIMVEDNYTQIATHLPEKSLLIFNNTRVIEARLLFQKPTGGMIEIFCLEPHEQYKDVTSAMSTAGKVWWKCLVGGASKWKAGQLLEKKIQSEDSEIILTAAFIEKRSSYFIIELSWCPAELSFAELLHHGGAIPLPPYIKRNPEDSDKERYQTVYARHDGSVAAPTAGLHFTENIFQQLKEKKIQTGFVTLHVGAGTFKPVKSAIMQEHDMHAEWIDVSKETIQSIVAHNENPIVAVGTTSLRTVESLYWLGVKLLLSHNTNSDGPDPVLSVSQWEPYQPEVKDISKKKALTALLDWMNKHQLEQFVARTQILIAPGYQFRIVEGLITNFHQPQSTLLLLVAALVGDDWKKVYDYALQHDFRFLSYGDGSLLWKVSGY